MSVEVQKAQELHLRPCKHQVAGHLFEEGKAGSLVDDSGHFYKPLQAGPRGKREREFYERLVSELRLEKLGEINAAPTDERGDESSGKEEASVSGRTDDENPAVAAKKSFFDKPFSARNAIMLRAVPRFYGTIRVDGTELVELEDVTCTYRHPSIVDIKVGLRTWYPGADPRHIERCKLKDAATTQAALGFKVCGMQVYRHCQRGYWRASKRWCKQLPQDAVSKALMRFANNEAGLLPEDVYGGPNGAIAQLQRLESWFQVQREFYFYSSSVLLIYEGDAESTKDSHVTLRLVDFAHTFPSNGKKDTNFIAGLRAIIKALQGVMRLDCHQEIAL